MDRPSPDPRGRLRCSTSYMRIGRHHRQLLQQRSCRAASTPSSAPTLVELTSTATQHTTAILSTSAMMFRTLAATDGPIPQRNAPRRRQRRRHRQRQRLNAGARAARAALIFSAKGSHFSRFVSRSCVCFTGKLGGGEPRGERVVRRTDERRIGREHVRAGDAQHASSFSS